MANLLATGATKLAALLKSHAGTSVTYKRGESQSVSLTVTVGQTQFEQVDGEGGLLRWNSRDFLITAADLILSESVTLPVKDDKIVEVGADGVTRTFVVAPVEGENCYRFSDTSRTILRVHTKQCPS